MQTALDPLRNSAFVILRASLIVHQGWMKHSRGQGCASLPPSDDEMTKFRNDKNGPRWAGCADSLNMYPGALPPCNTLTYQKSLFGMPGMLSHVDTPGNTALTQPSLVIPA